MTRDDLKYIPHSFAELNNINIITQHKEFILSGNFSQAVNLLSQNTQVEGMRAELFNNIEQKILYLKKQLEGKTKADYILYQQTEPTDEEFEGKVIWAQQY